MLFFLSDSNQKKFEDIVKRYKDTFELDFPVFEYIDGEVTDDKLDKITALIETSIAGNKPVDTPEDYAERIF